MPENPSNLRPAWIAIGWFVAVSICALVLLTFVSFGLLGEDPPGETIWVAVALTIGFFAAGFLVGMRVIVAPVLHGIGMGLFSLIAWVAVNLFLGEPTGETTWRSLDVLNLAGLLLLQTAAAVIGARQGVRWLRTPPPAP